MGIEWSGKGLPPLGLVCEAKMPPRGVQVAIKEWTWRKVEVVRLNNGVRASEREVLVFDLENTAPAWVDELRPIRTAEQIELEKKESDCRELMTLWLESDGVADFAINLHVAGWRKQASE